jgi:hypothetical protein
LLVSQEEEEEAAMAAIKRLLPSFNRVLVEKVVLPKKSAGGILLPESSKQVPAAPSHFPPFSSAPVARRRGCVDPVWRRA